MGGLLATCPEVIQPEGQVPAGVLPKVSLHSRQLTPLSCNDCVMIERYEAVLQSPMELYRVFRSFKANC